MALDAGLRPLTGAEELLVHEAVAAGTARAVITTRLLAASLGLRPSAVTIAHGTRARDKLVRVAGLSAAEIRRMLGWEASTRPSNSHGGLDMAPKPPALVTPRGTRGVPRRNASFTDSGS